MSTSKSSQNELVNVRSGPWRTGERRPALMIHIFFLNHVLDNLLEKKQQDVKASWRRWCDTLGNVLKAGNLVLCHLWVLHWLMLPTWTLLMTTFNLSWQVQFTMALTPFSKIMCSATLQILFNSGLSHLAQSSSFVPTLDVAEVYHSRRSCPASLLLHWLWFG